MSLGTRIAIAVIGFIAAGLFAYVAISGILGQNAGPLWVLAAICLLITLAAIPGKHAGIAGRLLAGILFAVMAGRLVMAILPALQHHAIDGRELKDAIKLFLIWGLPSGFVTLFGFYPRWGKYGQAFGKSSKEKSSTPKVIR